MHSIFWNSVNINHDDVDVIGVLYFLYAKLNPQNNNRNCPISQANDTFGEVESLEDYSYGHEYDDFTNS